MILVGRTRLETDNPKRVERGKLPQLASQPEGRGIGTVILWIE
jgi:hypothetical protein